MNGKKSIVGNNENNVIASSENTGDKSVRRNGRFNVKDDKNRSQTEMKE